MSCNLRAAVNLKGICRRSMAQRMFLLTKFVPWTISTEHSFRIGKLMYYHEETVKKTKQSSSLMAFLQVIASFWFVVTKGRVKALQYLRVGCP